MIQSQLYGNIEQRKLYNKVAFIIKDNEAAGIIKEKVNEKEGKDDNVLAYKTPEKVKPLNRFSNIIINDITSRKNLYLLFSQNVHG